MMGVTLGAMASVADVLRIAAAEIGTVEQPVNRQKYSAADHRPAESWCADFVVWVLRQAGVPVPLDTPNASALVRSFGPIQQLPQPGDVVGYHFAGEPAGIDHTGIVESFDLAARTVTSIDGNTSSGVAGSQSNGGGVYRRTRPFSQVVGFGRPTYKEAPVADQPAPLPDWKVNAAPVAVTAVADAQGNVTGYAILCADGGLVTFGKFPYLGRVHV